MSVMDMTTVKEKVAWCLEHKVETRSDDNKLTLSVWKNFYRKDFIRMIQISCHSLDLTIEEHILEGGAMNNLPSSESISRARRKIQYEDKQFLPSEETLKNRGKAETHVADWSMENKDTL